MYDTERINEYDDWISKSQLKRESKELHALGVEITKLSETEFERIDFTDHDTFRNELVFARKIINNTQHEPYRRQMLHIERLLRDMDVEFVNKIKTEVDAIRNKKVVGNAAFHRLEKMRDGLLGENSKTVLDQIVAENNDIDRNKLRTLIKKAKKEKEEGKPPTSGKELFRYLRDNILGDQNV
jgi:ribosome-associated protein